MLEVRRSPVGGTTPKAKSQMTICASGKVGAAMAPVAADSLKARTAARRKPTQLAVLRTVQVDAMRKGLKMMHLFSDHCRIVCDRDALRMTAEDALNSLKVCWNLYGDGHTEVDALGGSVESYECSSPVSVTIEFEALSEMLASHVTAVDMVISDAAASSRAKQAPKTLYSVQCMLHSRHGPQQQCTLELPVLNDEPEDLTRLYGLEALTYHVSTWVSAYSLQYAVRFVNVCGVKWIRLSTDTARLHMHVHALLGDEDDYAKYCGSPVLSRASVRVPCRHLHTDGSLVVLPVESPRSATAVVEAPVAADVRVATVYLGASNLHKLCKNIDNISNNPVDGLGPSVLLHLEPGKPVKISTLIGVVGTMHVWLAEDRPSDLCESRDQNFVHPQ